MKRPAIEPTAVVRIELYPIILLTKGKKLYASLPTTLIKYGVKKKDIIKLIKNDIVLNNPLAELI